MPTAGFFGWVWRFNALAIAIAATGAVIVLVLIALSFVSQWSRRGDWRAETGLVERDAGASQEMKYVLDRGIEVEGTPYVLYSLQRYKSELDPLPLKSAYRYDSRTVNLLLVDGAKASGRWLFDGVQQVVGVKNTVYDPATLGGETERRRAAALILEVYSSDTNKDGAIDLDDDVSLIAHRFDGGSRIVLVAGPLAIASIRQMNDGKIAVMYESGKKTVVANFDGNDFRALAKSELPRLSTERATDQQAPEIIR